MDWLILQLADSAFPTGGFAHSAGLEAAWQQGEVPDAAALQDFISDSLWQARHTTLPLANAAFENVSSLRELDSLCDAFLSNHVANRASRIQGRALLSTSEKCFPLPGLVALRQHVRDEKLKQHFAPLSGAIMREMGVGREWMQRLCLFVALRGVVSAAVRLGVVGPHQAQQMQFLSYETLNNVLDRCGDLGVEDLAQPAPLIDLFQATHDRLYSRLFQS